MLAFRIATETIDTLVSPQSELSNNSVNVVVADPWANPSEVEQVYDIKLGQIGSDSKLDSIIVAVGHNEYRDLSPEELRSFCQGPKPVIADVKSLYEKKALIDYGFSVFRL